MSKIIFRRDMQTNIDKFVSLFHTFGAQHSDCCYLADTSLLIGCFFESKLTIHCHIYTTVIDMTEKAYPFYVLMYQVSFFDILLLFYQNVNFWC
jgi:hypothetical protein